MAEATVDESGVTADSGLSEEDRGLDGAVFSDGQLSYLGQEAKVIPEELIESFADKTVRLDLSFNSMQALTGLDKFCRLQELVLDNNELGDDVVFPQMAYLSTLCLNKNRFLELEPLLGKLKASVPQLRYLSLLGNTACPNQLSSTEKDDEDYQRYRYHVLYHLPHLTFLDSSAVQQSELTEAKRRGQFMQVVRPGADDRTDEDNEELTPQFTPLPTDPQQFEEDKNLGFYGKSAHRYCGRHSEGNRFIRSKDL